MRADGLAHCLIWKSTHINANTATHHAANTTLRFHCQSRPVSPNFTFLRGINKCFVQPELPDEGRSHSWDWYESKSCFRSANLKSFAVLGPISSISVSGKQQMTERERESKKKPSWRLPVDFFLLLSNVFTHSQMFGGTVHPKVRRICLSHERTRCVSEGDTTSKCSMYEMWSSSGLGPLICHPGTPIFLSLSFSNVLWIWIFILKEVRWLLLRLSPFCVHVFLAVTVSGPDQTRYQPASVVWAACRLYSSGSVYIHVCPGPLWRTVYLNDDATTTGRINVSATSLN